MDFSDTIESFLTGTYTVTRTAKRTVDSKGRVGAASTSSVSMRASVQQATGRDLEVLPEGNRPAESIKFYTSTALQVASASFEADTFVYRGETFEVQHVERWDELGNYYKGIAVLA